VRAPGDPGATAGLLTGGLGLGPFTSGPEEAAPSLLTDVPAYPPGFRAEEMAGGDPGGYVPLAEAAERMSRSEEEVLRLARRGVLSYRHVRGRLLIQPAIVQGLVLDGEALA